MIFYFKCLIAFFKILPLLKQNKDFLNHPIRNGKGLGLLRKPLERRFIHHKQGKSHMGREDLFLYLSTIGFQEKELESLKEELLVLMSFLLVWYCEPIKEIPTEEE